MKTITRLTALIACGVLCLTAVGCKKSDQAGPTSNTVDIQALQQAFTGAAPDISASIFKVVSAVRYSQYDQAIVELDKLSTNAQLTDPQKKVVTDTLEQVKKLMAAPPAGAAPPPAK